MIRTTLLSAVIESTAGIATYYLAANLPGRFQKYGRSPARCMVPSFHLSFYTANGTGNTRRQLDVA